MDNLSLGWRQFRTGKKLCFILLIGLLCLAPAGSGWAMPTTEKQARQIVLNWLSLDQKPLGAALGQQLREVQVFSDKSGSPQYFVVYLNPAGFVVVAGDDLVEPIIAFVSRGSYDPAATNPMGALVSRDLPGRVAEARALVAAAAAQGQTFTPSGRQQEARRKWDLLLGDPLAAAPLMSSRLPDISDVRVAPLVTTKWSQGNDNDNVGPCYNYYTYWNNYHYPCGCVATAMAQLIRFWEWPQTGVGTDTFEISVDKVPQEENLRGGDGSGGVYKWADMINDPRKEATDAQRQAIGNLTHDAGAAVNMEYTSTASGSAANNSDAAKALVQTFGYSSAIYGVNAWNIPLPNLYNMINPNLDAAMPVILGTVDHAIICDGYGYNTYSLYHHLNLGWGGAEDAWYNLPTIDTEDQGTYKTIVECIYNVYKTGAGEIISGRVVDVNSNPLQGARVTAVLSGGGGSRSATSNSQGIYALTKLPAATSCTLTASLGGYMAFNTQKVSTGTSINNDMVCGNLWGVDFSGAKVKPITSILGLLLN